MGQRALFFLISTILAGGLISSCASTQVGPLSADQMRSLFSGKTADVYNTTSKASIRAFFAPDGSLRGRNLTTDKAIVGKWEINANGQHCSESNQAPKTCGNVIAQSDGTYHRTVDGIHTQTFSNFVDGNPANY
jgi:hypothetical protein